jgi:hypothetical protein
LKSKKITYLIKLFYQAEREEKDIKMKRQKKQTIVCDIIGMIVFVSMIMIISALLVLTDIKEQEIRTNYQIYTMNN